MPWTSAGVPPRTSSTYARPFSLHSLQSVLPGSLEHLTRLMRQAAQDLSFAATSAELALAGVVWLGCGIGGSVGVVDIERGASGDWYQPGMSGASGFGSCEGSAGRKGARWGSSWLLGDDFAPVQPSPNDCEAYESMRTTRVEGEAALVASCASTSARRPRRVHGPRCGGRGC